MIRISEPSSVRRTAAICCAVLCSGLFAAGARADEFIKSFPVAKRANVHVDTNDGSVRVTTGDTNQVEFRVEYVGFKLDKNLRVEASQQGEQVVLTARIVETWGFSIGNGRKLHIEVRMPKVGDLQIETGDGSVDASSVNGNVSIHTGDGSINAAALSGTVDLHSGDGALTANALKGTVRLRTGDGAIEGNNLDGKFDAVSGDGRVRLEGRFDALKIKTGDGSIDVRAAAGSKMESGWNIITGDGSIELTLPKDLQADVDASSSDGHVTSDIPITVVGETNKTRVRGKLNGGGQPLTIHTGDGSIHLKQT
jgi:DUF4097 and DUF4098 domain-containing protein YvlB